jgi:hypothetical protein
MLCLIREAKNNLFISICKRKTEMVYIKINMEEGNQMANELEASKNQLPANDQEEFLALTEAHAEEGISFRPEDQLLPLIYVLQSGSPIVEKRSESYVEGAEPGHFWLRNTLNPIRNGETGIIAVPVRMVSTWVEWMPNRGGFVTSHESRPPDTKVSLVRGDDGRERQTLVRSSGNVIVETRNIYLLIDGSPYVLPCTSTKHTFARNWQTLWHEFKHPNTGKIMPAYARRYRLTTVGTSNAIGKWFGLKFEDAGWASNTEIKTGIAFTEALIKGERRADSPAEIEDPPF